MISPSLLEKVAKELCKTDRVNLATKLLDEAQLDAENQSQSNSSLKAVKLAFEQIREAVFK